MSLWRFLDTYTDLTFQEDAEATVRQFVAAIGDAAPDFRDRSHLGDRWEDFVLLTAAELALAPAAVISPPTVAYWPDVESSFVVTGVLAGLAIGKATCTYWDCPWDPAPASLEHVIAFSGDVLKLRAIGFEEPSRFEPATMGEVVNALSEQYSSVARWLGRPPVEQRVLQHLGAIWYGKTVLILGRPEEEGRAELESYLREAALWRE